MYRHIFVYMVYVHMYVCKYVYIYIYTLYTTWWLVPSRPTLYVDYFTLVVRGLSLLIPHKTRVNQPTSTDG